MRMPRDDALLTLLLRLRQLDYRFVAVTPASHERVLARGWGGPPTLRDVFGWNRPFAEDQLERGLLEAMEAAGILHRGGEGLRSGLRVASLGDDLFLHSAFPTDDADAVFFGPDTYRFARFIAEHLPGLSPAAIADMGAGSGAGGLFAARLAPGAAVTLVDSNAAALALARVNARAAGLAVELVHADRLPSSPDLVIANPPYMIDDAGRAYRHGGALFGGQVALEWTRDALARLRPGGTLLLYTGAAIVDGAAPLLAELEQACGEAGAEMTAEELDPDVFGEELAKPRYAAVERIAALGVVVKKRS
jgi:methylase of polypeptide subunit release factors